jgi:hypothetical protein
MADPELLVGQLLPLEAQLPASAVLPVAELRPHLADVQAESQRLRPELPAFQLELEEEQPLPAQPA